MSVPAIEEPNTNQLLVGALEQRWKNYGVELKRCQAEFSNEAVHDLRVATRRMLAFIRLLNSISPRPRLRKLTRAFKDQLDEFDELRDTQVILAEVSQIMQELPQLQDFQKHLQCAEEKLLRNLRKKIKRFESSKTNKRISKTYAAIVAETNSDLRLQVMQAVDDIYLITKQRCSWVNLTRSATIHHVRVAFKSLRYMIEIVQPLLKDFPMENLKRMNDYQSLMGEVQDAEVFVQTLADFSEHASFSIFKPVRHYYEKRHTDAISAYAKEMNQLDTFLAFHPRTIFSLGENQMKIYLIRHGNAVDHGTPGYEDDSLRPLTTSGRAKMNKIASALKKLGMKPDLIVSSPYVRARQTAEILAKVLKYKSEPVFSDMLVPMGNAENIIEEINTKYNVAELVLVGHEPCLSILIGTLTAGNPELTVNLKKGGVCCLSSGNLQIERKAVLEWLLTPKILIELA